MLTLKPTYESGFEYRVAKSESLNAFFVVCAKDCCCFSMAFDWEDITAPNSKDSQRFKDFLRQRGVNWKGDLQFTKIDNAIFVKSTLNSHHCVWLCYQ